MEEISCIKDGITGVCRNIKDKSARERLDAIESKDYFINDGTPQTIPNTDINGVKGAIYYTEEVTGSTLALRTLNGRLKAETPTEDNDLTTKSYVDGLISSASAGGTGGSGLTIVGTMGNYSGSVTLEDNKLYLIVGTFLYGYTASGGTSLATLSTQNEGIYFYNNSNYKKRFSYYSSGTVTYLPWDFELVDGKLGLIKVSYTTDSATLYVTNSSSNSSQAGAVNIKVYEVG